MGKRFVIVLSILISVHPLPLNTAALPETLRLAQKEQPALKETAAKEDSEVDVKRVWVTAYSSTEEETDDTPFITAQGTGVRDGIVAANFLSFGTLLQIPKLFGERIFVVEDRMHRRKINFIDIWMPTKEKAEEFGIYYTDIVILGKEIAEEKLSEQAL